MTTLTKLNQTTLRSAVEPITEELGIPLAKTLSLKATGPLFDSILEGIKELKANAGSSIYGRNPDREDGFNYAYYAKIRPDVVAAGIDPLTHWLRNGRFEGNAPYEGGPTTVDWSTLTADDYARLPAPKLEMPDMYFPAGTKVAYAIARLADVGGQRPWRTFEAKIDAVGAEPGYPNGQGRGFFKWEGGRTLDTVFGPHNDWTIEFEVEIAEDKPGAFIAFLNGGTSHPQIGNNGQKKSVIHIGVEPPEGYVHPQRPSSKPQAVAPVPKTWDYETDFLGDISDWHRPQFDLNGATGLLVGSETTTKSGRKVFEDTTPIVNGVRRMQIVDLGDDPIIHSGTAYPYAMPSLRKMLGDGLNYYMEVDFRWPQVRGLDPGMWYWDQFELDHLEIFSGSDRTHTVSFHTPDGIVPTYNPFGPATTRRTLCILRTPTRYAQWQQLEGETEKRLIVDGPNYAGNVALPFGMTFEGVGGTVAGSPDPNVNYGEIYGELFGLRFKQL